MTREIKFRAWDNLHSEWLGSDWWSVNPDGTIDCGSYEDGDRVQLPVVRINLMQYTGLKDRNGVEIYEGDIVKRIATSGGLYESRHSVRVIEWHEYTAHVGWNIGIGREANQGDRLKYTEVIGNIYETPELVP